MGGPTMEAFPYDWRFVLTFAVVVAALAGELS